MERYDRPPLQLVNFATSRFVVSTWRGLDLGDRKLEYGDELPADALSPYALRCEYDAHRIEVMEYAKTVPELREAYARKTATGKSYDLDAMTRRELAALCEQHSLPSNGGKDELRHRLAAVVV